MTKTIKHKAIVGYLLLAFGCAYSINGVTQALHDSKERGQITRGIICSILTQSDEESLRSLKPESKFLHIKLSDLEQFEESQLKVTAKYRKELAPSTPDSACQHGVTRLSITP